MYKDEAIQIITEIELAAKRIKYEVDSRDAIASKVAIKIVDKHIKESIEHLCVLIQMFREAYEKSNREKFPEIKDVPQEQEEDITGMSEIRAFNSAIKIGIRGAIEMLEKQYPGDNIKQHEFKGSETIRFYNGSGKHIGSYAKNEDTFIYDDPSKHTERHRGRKE